MYDMKGPPHAYIEAVYDIQTQQEREREREREREIEREIGTVHEILVLVAPRAANAQASLRI